MDQRNLEQKVVAIVPAYNEAERIGAVLDILTTHPQINEVIVVDDGSTDATSSVVSTYPVTLLRNEQNQGKGHAMDQAVAATTMDILFFCDADVRGLTHDIITDILSPVLSTQYDMMIAMRNRKIYYLRTILNILPILGGERALTRALWMHVPREYKNKFKIEAALNFYAKYYGHGFGYKVFPGLTQTIKEKKYGFWRGVTARIRMFLQVASAQAQLQLSDVPKTVRSGRLALTTALGSLVGTSVGIVLLLASYTGPVQFFRELFAQPLTTDPSTPVIDSILHIAANAGADALVVSGVILIGINTTLLLLSLRNTIHLIRIVMPRHDKGNISG